MTRSLPLAAIAAALLSAGAPAVQAREVRVSYADLDLSTSLGVHALDRRISRAIKQICATTSERRNLTEHLLARECRAALAPGVTQQRDGIIAGHAGSKQIAMRVP